MTKRVWADAFAHGGREICHRYLHCAGHGDTRCGNDRQLAVQLARHARVLQTLHRQRLAAADGYRCRRSASADFYVFTPCTCHSPPGYVRPDGVFPARPTDPRLICTENSARTSSARALGWRHTPVIFMFRIGALFAHRRSWSRKRSHENQT